jgi:hypothetical protein
MEDPYQRCKFLDTVIMFVVIFKKFRGLIEPGHMDEMVAIAQETG